ncbi:MAG: glycosyltransferase [Rhodocyclaceae bacterium]
MAQSRVGVLIFHPANVFGGAERTVMNLLSHVARDRVRVVLVGRPEVFRDPPADAFHSLAELGLDDGFAGLPRAVRDARILTALARREDCRVMLGMLHYGAIVAPLCRLFSGGRLRTIASPRTPSSEGIRFHVGEGGRQAWLWRTMVSGFCRFSDRVLVASDGLRRECVERFGARPERVRVVPNSVDDALIAFAAGITPRVREHAESGRPWHIVTAGRLAPEKDLGTLIRAFALLRASLDARLEIIGSGPELPALQALAAELGVGDRIDFAGFTPRPLERIREADVFVHTALFEGFGNVLLEAMACGVPLIATDCDFGPREIVRDGVNGRLVRMSDPAHLAAVLAEVLDDAPQRARLADTALQAIRDYSAERMAEGYERLFAELGWERSGSSASHTRGS